MLNFLPGGTIKSELATQLAETNQQKQWYEGIMTSIPTPMFVTDKDLIITWINDSGLSAMGYSRDEVVGKMSCADFSKTPLCGTESCTLRNCMRTREAIHGETMATTRSGQQIPIQAACAPVFDDDGQVIGGMEVIIDRSAAARAKSEADNMLKPIGATMFVTNKELIIWSGLELKRGAFLLNRLSKAEATHHAKFSARWHNQE